MKSSLLIILSFFYSLVYCHELIPLKVGNSWTYEQKTIFKDGTIKIDTVVNEVLRDTLIAGETWYVLREFGDEFIVKNEDGNQFEYWEEATLFYKNPEKSLGEKYKVGEFTLIEIAKEIVKIHNFHGNNKCYHYSIFEEELEIPIIQVFIAPELGVVHHSWLIDGHVIESQLIDFKL